LYCFKVISITVRPPSDFSVLENFQTITQQNYVVRVKVTQQHCSDYKYQKCPPLATTRAFSRLKKLFNSFVYWTRELGCLLQHFI